MVIVKLAPLAVWQSVQRHAKSVRGSEVTSNRTASQRHPPHNGENRVIQPTD